MKKYFSLVEARVRDAADILTQMPQNQSQRPPPRVLKLLEDAEEAIKAQYKRMNDTLEAVANKVVDDIDPIPKDEPKESREGPYTYATHQILSLRRRACVHRWAVEGFCRRGGEGSHVLS